MENLAISEAKKEEDCKEGPMETNAPPTEAPTEAENATGDNEAEAAVDIVMETSPSTTAETDQSNSKPVTRSSRKGIYLASLYSSYPLT